MTTARDVFAVIGVFACVYIPGFMVWLWWTSDRRRHR